MPPGAGSVQEMSPPPSSAALGEVGPLPSLTPTEVAVNVDSLTTPSDGLLETSVARIAFAGASSTNTHPNNSVTFEPLQPTIEQRLGRINLSLGACSLAGLPELPQTWKLPPEPPEVFYSMYTQAAQAGAAAVIGALRGSR